MYVKYVSDIHKKKSPTKIKNNQLRFTNDSIVPMSHSVGIARGNTNKQDASTWIYHPINTGLIMPEVLPWLNWSSISEAMLKYSGISLVTFYRPVRLGLNPESNYRNSGKCGVRENLATYEDGIAVKRSKRTPLQSDKVCFMKNNYCTRIITTLCICYIRKGLLRKQSTHSLN